MFTKSDYQKYFEEITLTERVMVIVLNDFILSVKDKDILSQIQPIISDEIKHYKAMLDILDKVIFEADNEKRDYFSVHSPGEAFIHDTRTKRDIKTFFIDYSDEGICVESDEPFLTGAKYDVSLKYHKDEMSPARSGIIRWSIQINDSLYMARIGFFSR